MNDVKILKKADLKFEPKVSIVVPVYNVEKYLKQCLNSITNQTLKEIEIICVDDGSSDNSLQILQYFAAQDNRFTILAQEHLMAGVARNNGMKLAKGQYLAFLDSDDFFESDMLQIMYQKAVDTNSDIVMCDMRKYDNQTHKFSSPTQICTKNFDIIIPLQTQINIFDLCASNAWTKLFRRQFILDNDLYFQNLKSCNDIGFSFCSAAVANKIALVPQPLVNYRINTGTQISSNRGKKDFNIVYAYKFIKDFLLKNKLEVLLNDLKERIYHNFEDEISRYESDNIEQITQKCREILQEDYPFFADCFHYEYKKYCFFGFSLVTKKSIAKKTTYKLFNRITLIEKLDFSHKSNFTLFGFIKIKCRKKKGK